MSLFTRNRLDRMKFHRQLIAALSIGIVCVSLISWGITSALTGRSLEATYLAQGLRITEGFARESTLALLYGSADNARDAARAALSFPDVLGVEIYDADLNLLYAQGEADEREAMNAGHVYERPTLYRDSAAAWHFAVAVRAGGAEDQGDSLFVTEVPEPELIGAVRVVVGKDTLKSLAAETLRSSLYSLGVAALLLLPLVVLTTRLTRPLQKLAETMYKAEQGYKGVRADLRGPQEVSTMGTAFNTMMAVLEQRERELERARDAALESARLKGEFVTNVSHDLRTPMNGVLGMLEVLHGMKLTPKQREYVEVAASSGRALLSLIDDLLDFSRIESGRLELQRGDFSLHEILEDVIDLFASQVRRKRLELSYALSAEIPAMVCGDPVRLRQILINLVGNAVKFTEEGQVRVEVSLVEAEGDRVTLRFEVHDTGIGVRPEDARRIFEPFAQADGSSTRKHGGTGLGLAICRQIVEVMGGDIGVDAREGGGSVFWFTANMQETSRQPDAQTAVGDELSGARILIVGANQVSERFVASTLGRRGAHCGTTGEGRQGLAMLRTAAARGAAYAAVLFDELAPDMNAASFVEAMSNEASIVATRVVVLRARWQDGLDRSPLPCPTWHLEKPIREASLLATVRAVVRGFHAAAAQRQPPLLPPPEDVVAGRHVLVVEDNRTNQQVALAMLERIGCRVTLAAGGGAALRAFAAEDFDAVLMDCNMPEMDGYETTRRLRALDGRGRSVPVIAMTANVQRPDVERCFDSGMVDYLPKPLRLERLQEKLYAWLGRTGTVRGPAGAKWPQDDTDQRAPLDLETLEELRKGVGAAFPTLVTVTLEDLPRKLRSLAAAVEARDGSALRDVAHNIKGNARTFGARRLAQTAFSLEKLGRTGSTDGAESLLAEMLVEWDRVRAALAAEQGKQRPVSKVIMGSAATILVVDDDRGTRFALRKALEVNGHRIEEAGNGAQALALCERRRPDLVLMDAVMPVMDGFAACQRVRELPGGGHQIPVLIITALDDEESIEKAFAAGATDYVPKPVHFAVLRQRVTRLLQARRAEEHVRQLAYHDTLTGLPNRAQFIERTREMLRYHSGDHGVLAVLFIDLDRFKLVNDTLGHDTGDLLLRGVAERINGCLRGGDLVARLGGDEFTILLTNLEEPQSAAAVAEKVGIALSRPFVFSGQQLYASASIGISIAPSDGNDVHTLIKHADTAMFRAKERGNRYEFYEHTMGVAMSRQLELETAIRKGLERGEFVIYYQPQRDLESGRIVAAEALVRWHHPVRGLVLPGEFIPVAEQSGLIVPLGEYVLQLASLEVEAWHRLGLPPLRLAVNVSGRQLDEPNLVERVASILQQTGLDPALLELEITESSIMKRPQDAIIVLRRLREMGIKLAIDDFGTGYSSLNYLKRFPIDTLKIDRSFISDIATDPDDAAITSGIIALAHGLRLTVTAEGVETDAHRRFLGAHGCDTIQGLYVSEPLPSAVFTERILLVKGVLRTH